MRIAAGVLLLASWSWARDAAAVEDSVDSYLHAAKPERVVQDGFGTLAIQPTASQDWTFGIGFTLWYPRITGSIQTPGGTRFSLNEIDIGGNDFGGVAQFAASKGPWIIQLEVYSVRWAGRLNLARDLTFGNTTYQTGESVQSDFQKDQAGLLGGYSVVRTGAFELSLFGGAEYWSYTARLIGSTSGVTRIQDNYAMPFLGISAAANWNDFYILFLARGYYMDAGRRRTGGWRAELVVGWYFHERWTVYVGYSGEDVKTTGGDLSFDGRMHGVVLGVVVFF